MKVRVEQFMGFPNGEGVYGLVTETNLLLYTHFCSNINFAYKDLYDDRPERQEELIERFGKIETAW